MKTQLLLFFIFCILNQLVKAQAIKNGDFETGNINFWNFSNPSTYTATASPGYTYTVAKDSTKQNSSVLHISSAGNSMWCQFRQTIAYRPSGSLEKMRLSADVKIRSTAYATANLSTRILQGKKNFSLFEKTLEDNQDWQKISVDFILNPQTDSLVIYCLMKGEGDVWFDNVNIEKITSGKIEQSAEAKAYLDTAISIINKNALYKDSVDFKSLVLYSNVIAADAKTPEDCYGAIRYILEGLQDYHSFFQTAKQAAYLDRDDDTSMLMPYGKLIDKNIGYLKIPQCMAINSAMEKKYADSLKKVIQLIDNRSIMGWIVDNRGNTGGNCWPMILGLGPVLGDGIFELRKKNGSIIDSAGYWNGVVRNKDSVIIKTDIPYKIFKPFPKVALLMDGMSASSGESVLLSFKFRPKTKFFGEPSYGLTTANNDYTLSDGAIIFLCFEKQTDRLGNEYSGKLYPDVTIQNDETTATDRVIEAATKWLKTD